MGKNTKPIAAALWLVALGIGGWLLFSPSPDRTPAEAAQYKMESAMLRCENATKDSVADASGMTFAPFGEWLLAPEGDDNNMTFVYEVVAKDATGALVPASMKCVAQFDGEYWTAVSITQQ